MIRVIRRCLNKKELTEHKWNWHFAFFHFKDYKNVYLNGKPLKPWHILKNGDVVEIYERPAGIFETIGTFVLKTVKRFETNSEKAFMPMYKDEEDSMFGEQLFTQAVLGRDRCDNLINRFIVTENWDADRVAFMDRVVMDVAITEVLNYPAIPTRVTLNEYIEIAKYYSTPRSGQFVNGILNSIINYLKDERIIVKE